MLGIFAEYGDNLDVSANSREWPAAGGPGTTVDLDAEAIKRLRDERIGANGDRQAPRDSASKRLSAHRLTSAGGPRRRSWALKSTQRGHPAASDRISKSTRELPLRSGHCEARRSTSKLVGFPHSRRIQTATSPM